MKTRPPTPAEEKQIKQIDAMFNEAELARRHKQTCASDTSTPEQRRIGLNEGAEFMPKKTRKSCCGHASDCAVHNAPALPVGPCDCGLVKPKVKVIRGVAIDNRPRHQRPSW